MKYQDLPITGRVWQWRQFSLRLSLRNLLVCSFLLALALMLGCYAMTVGRLPIGIPQVLAALSGSGDELNA